MKSFRTELKVHPSPYAIRLSNTVFTIGSCFSDSIGDLFKKNKFAVAVNPLGVIYNPISIHKTLAYGIQQRSLSNGFIEHEGLWHHYDFHSSFSSTSRVSIEENLKNEIRSTHEKLKSFSYLIITYGTAVAFEHRDNQEIVANCHRVPAKEFVKKLLSVEAIVESFNKMLQTLLVLNPSIKIILTVSPVRHVKDTLELNSVSKAILRLAVHQIIEQHPTVEYFPAFELMTDDLRDYRFYSADMLHPTAEAIEYIWGKFSEKYFSDDTREFLKKWGSLQAALHHKPFHVETPSHQKFLQETLLRLEELKPEIDVEEEIKQIKSQLLIGKG